LNSEGVDVYNAEKILKISGYDVDAPDMKLDAKTFNALKKFQKDSKLYPYGILDFGTQKALNKKLDALILTIDKQYAKALEILKK
jgi:carboxyl-terminal processing protease